MSGVKARPKADKNPYHALTKLLTRRIMAARSNPASSEKEEPMSASAEGKRTALVTGANSGLGKAIAAALAAEKMRVGLVVRDRVRGESALEEIRAATGNDDLHLFVADLADQ
jgi:protein subunit release factor A